MTDEEQLTLDHDCSIMVCAPAAEVSAVTRSRK